GRLRLRYGLGGQQRQPGCRGGRQVRPLAPSWRQIDDCCTRWSTDAVAGEKGTKSSKTTKEKKERIVKKAFFLPESQFRALKIYAATNDLGVSEALQQLLAKAGLEVGK